MKADPREFAHLPLDRELESISGRYVFTKEEVARFRGRELLYRVGCAAFDRACCGEGGCGYALVPGWLVQKHVKRDPEGNPVSLVEPVEESERGAVSELLKSREPVSQVIFL